MVFFVCLFFVFKRNPHAFKFCFSHVLSVCRTMGALNIRRIRYPSSPGSTGLPTFPASPRGSSRGSSRSPRARSPFSDCLMTSPTFSVSSFDGECKQSPGCRSPSMFSDQDDDDPNAPPRLASQQYIDSVRSRIEFGSSGDNAFGFKPVSCPGVGDENEDCKDGRLPPLHLEHRAFSDRILNLRKEAVMDSVAVTGGRRLRLTVRRPRARRQAQMSSTGTPQIPFPTVVAAGGRPVCPPTTTVAESPTEMNAQIEPLNLHMPLASATNLRQTCVKPIASKATRPRQRDGIAACTRLSTPNDSPTDATMCAARILPTPVSTPFSATPSSASKSCTTSASSLKHDDGNSAAAQPHPQPLQVFEPLSSPLEPISLLKLPIADHNLGGTEERYRLY